MKFLPQPVEFTLCILQFRNGRFTICGSRAIQFFGEILTHLLSQFGQFLCLLLHQWMFGRLFSQLPQLIALSLFFLADRTDFFLNGFVPLLAGFFF